MQLNALKNISRNPGFTMMELMVVAIVIAIISGFALPNFSRAMTKARVRDAQAQLSAVYAANMIERARNPATGFFTLISSDIATINNTLGINLVANGLTYNYNGGGGVFTATAGNGNFTVRINQNPIDPLVSPNRNPCCSVGTCPGLGAC